MTRMVSPIRRWWRLALTIIVVLLPFVLGAFWIASKLAILADAGLGDPDPPDWRAHNKTEHAVMIVINGAPQVLIGPNVDREFSGVEIDQDSYLVKAYRLEERLDKAWSIRSDGLGITGPGVALVYCALSSRSDVERDALAITIVENIHGGILDDFLTPCPGP